MGKIKTNKLLTMKEISNVSGICYPTVRKYTKLPGAEKYQVNIEGRKIPLYKVSFIDFCRKERKKAFHRRGKKKKRGRPAFKNAERLKWLKRKRRRAGSLIIDVDKSMAMRIKREEQLEKEREGH